MLSLTALHAIFPNIVRDLTSPKILYAYLIRNIRRSCIRVPRILRRFEIVKYVHVSITGGGAMPSSTVAYS